MASSAGFARRRVRTPGKHIVAFIAGVVLVIAAAATMLDHPGARISAASPGPFAPLRIAGATYAPLGDFLVDLSPDRQGRIAYLKLTASLKFSGAGAARAAAQADAARADIDERITFFLRGLTPEDFAGSEGLARVKREMLRRANIAIAPEEAADLVISDLVIQ